MGRAFESGCVPTGRARCGLAARWSLRDCILQLVEKTLFFRTSFADWVWSGHLIALLAMAGLVAHTY
jgi:hypothetical protein